MRYKINDLLIQKNQHVIEICVVTGIVSKKSVCNCNKKDYEVTVINSNDNSLFKKGTKVIFPIDYLEMEYNYHKHITNDELMAMIL